MAEPRYCPECMIEGTLGLGYCVICGTFLVFAKMPREPLRNVRPYRESCTHIGVKLVTVYQACTGTDVVVCTRCGLGVT